MGHFIFLLELTISFLLFIALITTVSARTKTMNPRWIVSTLITLVITVFWVLLLSYFYRFFNILSDTNSTVISILFMTALFIIGSGIIIKLGFRQASDSETQFAEKWKCRHIAAAMIFTITMTCTSFWMLDQAVLRKMTAILDEANNIQLSYMREPVPDSQNAYTFYKRACDLLDSRYAKDNPWDQIVRDPLEDKSTPYTPEDPKLLDFIDNNQDAIELSKKASTLKDYNFGIEYDFFQLRIQIPHIQILKRCSFLHQNTARVAISQGKPQQANDELNRCYRIAELLNTGSYLISSLVACKIERYSFETFQYILDSENTTAELIADHFEIRPISHQSSLYNAMHCEKAAGMSAMGVHAMNTHGAGKYHIHKGDLDYVGDPYSNALRRVFIWEPDLKLYINTMQEYAEAATEPYNSVISKFAAIDGKWEQSSKIKQLFCQSWAAHLGKAAEIIAQADAQNSLSRLAIEMCRFKKDNGHYPENLSQLVPKYIPNVPVDPFSGKDMKLLHTADTVTIYSTGKDLFDDNGLTDDIALRLKK